MVEGIEISIIIIFDTSYNYQVLQITYLALNMAAKAKKQASASLGSDV